MLLNLAVLAGRTAANSPLKLRMHVLLHPSYLETNISTLNIATNAEGDMRWKQ